jgi:hypothetical protein
MPAGRPTEKTEEVIRKIEEAAAMDCSVEEMASFAGIHRATLYRWIDEDEELKDRISELKLKPFLKARQTIIKSLENPQHAFEYMKRKNKKEFGDNVDVTTGGEALQPVLVKFIDADDRNTN